MANCIHCQAALPRPDSKFCANCGQPQSGPPAGAAVPQPMAPQVPVFNAPTTVLNQSTARLVIQDSGSQPVHIPLSGLPLSLGRAKDNDLVVASRFVSSHHARIEPAGAGHTIVDLNSTNGLLFNGARVPAHTFRDGDVVRIGDPLTGNFVTLTYQNVAQPAVQAVAQPVNRCELTAPVVTIGREGNVLNLPNPQVSRRHAEVRTI
ncbi:MAG TPA: FHA domain-containing protein [Herpetosiphonaceae bacterium]|nr:FHA domain-containing protein [Herpetosiphonaceae bacterium]